MGIQVEGKYCMKSYSHYCYTVLLLLFVIEFHWEQIFAVGFVNSCDCGGNIRNKKIMFVHFKKSLQCTVSIISTVTTRVLNSYLLFFLRSPFAHYLTTRNF